MFLAEGQSLPYINTAVRGDLYYHLHLSGVTIIGLAPSHRILTEKLEVINFKWKKLGESGQVQLAGKRKVGASQFSPDDTVVVIECKNGEEFHVKPYIRGRLAETNSSYSQQPIPIDPNIAIAAAANAAKNQGKGRNNNKGKNQKGGQQQQNTAATQPPASTEPPAPPPAPLPIPDQVYEPALLESYKLLHEDPARRGYLCMFLLTPEQMQLMIRLFLSTRDYDQLCKQRAQFEQYKIDNNIDFSKLHFPRIMKALALPKPTFIINTNGGRPMLSFKKGEFKVKNGVYKNLYENLEFQEKLIWDVDNNDNNDNTTTTTTATTTNSNPAPTGQEMTDGNQDQSVVSNHVTMTDDPNAMVDGKND